MNLEKHLHMEGLQLQRKPQTLMRGDYRPGLDTSRLLS
jgi:hypothetical protein